MAKVIVVTDGIQGPPGPPGDGLDLFAIDGIEDGQTIIWSAALGKFIPADFNGDIFIDGGTPSTQDFVDELDGGGI